MQTEYVAHFGLKEPPFRRNQHPKWLHLSAQHKEAVIKTRWTIEEFGGLALWRGDVGFGKSTLIEYLMTVWPKQFGWRCAKLQNTGTISGPRTLLAEVVSAFGMQPETTTRKMVSQLETWLLNEAIEHDKPVVLFIDEAQSISSRAFPVIRDLINLQTQDRILLQIVLAGQLNLERKLKNFPALRSRIASATTLGAFTHAECDAMLLHRFDVAGASDPFRILTGRATQAIHQYSKGCPRDIITLAEAAMKEACLRDARIVDAEHVAAGYKSLAGRWDDDAAPAEAEGASVIPLATGAPHQPLNRSVVGSLQQMRELANAA